MATDHYLNKVFVYIPREDNNSPPTISCPFTGPTHYFSLS